MKISDLYEDGRIVKGVNTTVDVGTNEIPIQAKKFGNSVTKDGTPPSLSTKVKGKSTNVLFNLGLTEGYKLQLERDSKMLVLNIINTKTGKRTEVRGKPGYESGNYDANDKLHQLLDTLGKSVDISQLMNGEPVGIRPDHPDGAKAKKATDKAYNESTDLNSLRKFVRSQREAPDQVLYQMMMAPDTYGHSASNFVRSWYEKTKEENGLKDVDSALEIMVDELGLNENTDKAYNENSSSIMREIQALHFAEALGEINEKTEIYVDMDGVLADFFGEWSKSQGVSTWKDIKDPQRAIGDIKSIEDFWLKLPVLPQAKNLLQLIKKVKGSYSICTSPLADDPRSEPHKREWVKKNLSFFPPKEVIVTHNKPQFAKQKDGTPNILIDDYGVNIRAWEEAGGIGFKYKDYKFDRTADAIKKQMDTVESTFVEDVNIDNKDGWGAVPWNQEVDYRGLRVKMKPSVFEKLAASRGGEPAVDKVVQHIKDGGAIGAPFLQIRVDEDDSQIPEVAGHEGRSRMLAIAEAHGDVPVEVHLFFQGKVNRARHITPEFIEKIQRYLISENDVMVRGPLFEI